MTNNQQSASGDLERSAPVEKPSALVEEPSAPVEEPSAPVEEPSAPVEEPSALVEEPSAAKDEQPREKLNPLQVAGSVFAAGLGVQSSRNRERDFKQGKAGVFIAAGIIFTALFVGAVYTIVSIVLSSR